MDSNVCKYFAVLPDSNLDFCHPSKKTLTTYKKKIFYRLSVDLGENWYAFCMFFTLVYIHIYLGVFKCVLLGFAPLSAHSEIRLGGGGKTEILDLHIVDLIYIL